MWKPKEHIVWRVRGELLVVLDTVSGHYYTLNDTAVELWRGLFEKNQALPEVLTGLRDLYPDAPGAGELEADCREALAQWKTEGLVDEVIQEGAGC